MSNLSFSFKMCISFFISPHYFYMATEHHFLLLVLVWQHQGFFFFNCWFLCGSSKTSYCWFLCDNNKVSFFHAWSVGLVRCWVGIWSGWSVRTEWEMMGMDGHKRLFRKWKCLMFSGSSWHFLKSLINKNSCYFTSSFTSMEALVDMNGRVYAGAI